MLTSMDLQPWILNHYQNVRLFLLLTLRFLAQGVKWQLLVKNPESQGFKASNSQLMGETFPRFSF